MESTAEFITDEEITDNIIHNRNMEATIGYLYKAHYEHLAKYVLYNNGNEQDGEDIFQEVVVMFIRSVQLRKFRGESSIRTFLYALNRNTWLNELKRRGRAEAREQKSMMVEEPEMNNANWIIEKREGHRILLETMEKLGNDCKQLLLLYYYENHSMKEIAEVTHYENEQVVRNKKYKCLKKLEEMITVNKLLYQQLKSLLNG